MPNQDEPVHFLPTSSLQPNPLQPRGKIHKEELDDLIISIKNYGILEPIVVAQTPAGYQIIAGERRWRAAKASGLKEVPVVVKTTSPKGMLEMALVENVQRTDLSPLERGQAFKQLIRDFKFSQLHIANRIGKSLAYVSNAMRLLDLPDAIKDGLLGGQITEGHARAILSVVNERDMVELYKTILKENASVRRAEELARRKRIEAGKAFKSTPPVSKHHNEEIDRWQEALKTKFGEKSEVKLTRSAQQTRVIFLFKGKPHETQAELKKLLDSFGVREDIVVESSDQN